MPARSMPANWRSWAGGSWPTSIRTVAGRATRRRPGGSLRFRDRDGGYELAGWLDREATEVLRAALSPLAAPRPSTNTEIDLRNAAQRDADALVDLASRALSDGELPTEGGERPQVVVVVTASLPVCKAGSAPPTWPSAVRSTPTSPAGSPVTRGSSRWYWAPEASRWISAGPPAPCPPRSAARSSSATADAPFPGCSVPARWCDIHHLVHWLNHGPTNLENCVALCGRHHRLLHHSP